MDRSWTRGVPLTSPTGLVGGESSVTTRSTRLAPLIFWLLGVVASAELLPMLNKSLWLDEGASLYSAHLGWGALWSQSKVVDRVLLPYYVLLHLWVEISPSIEWVRFLSVLAFGLTVVVIGLLGNRLGGLWCGVIAAVLTAANPLMIDGALDARPYALSALAVTLAIFALLRWHDRGEVRWFWWFCIAVLVALMLQLFSVIAPLGVLVVVLPMRPSLREKWRSIIVPLGITLLLSAAFALLVLDQRGQVAWIPTINMSRLLIDVYGPAGGYPALGKLRYAKLIVLLAAFAIALIWLRRRRRGGNSDKSTFEYFAVALTWAALPTIALISISYLHPVYVDRYVTASAPGMALTVGLLLGSALKLDQKKRPAWQCRVEIVACGLIVVGLAVNSMSIARTPFENYRAVARYLVNHAGSTGEVALPDHSVQASVEYYLAKTQAGHRTWPTTPSQHYISVLDLRESRRAFSSGAANVWVVEDGTTDLNRFLKNLTSHGYVVSGTHSISGLRTLSVAHYLRSGD